MEQTASVELDLPSSPPALPCSMREREIRGQKLCGSWAGEAADPPCRSPQLAAHVCEHMPCRPARRMGTGRDVPRHACKRSVRIDKKRKEAKLTFLSFNFDSQLSDWPMYP